ncbi:hypothetical protein [Spirosoma montaniterrae]|uniref:Glycosyltransferase RgtA/B/C/D-like domain-containing protein n=1 Tax=Spirosoma montaniterrae TaxID=1178516 RepID=A0A1P9WXM1_9BACT|nr:hypothetical protein [Spirosoma montaniterrae]AQG80103.1 hypothetical protein AWR27_12660 [Spirosoma montaniterrae]
MPHALISQRNVSILLSFFIVLTGLTYWHRYPTGDDAWFAEQSYWLQKEGVIRSEFFRGILGWENQLLVSHKLFLLFGAGLIRLFGYQLPTVQFVGFICFCVLVAQLIYYVRQHERNNTGWYVLAVLVLVFANRVMVRMSFENRPELMLAAFGFGSFLCLQSRPTTPVKTVLAAMLAGMAMLAHLNGVIYLIAGFGLLLYQRQYKNGLIFAVAGGLTGLLYFVDVMQATNGFSVWYYQFRNDPATQDAFGLMAKLLVMLTYPKLFFESPEQAALSLLLVFLLWHQRRLLSRINQPLRVYALILLVSFWLLTKKGSGTYLPLFMPFMFALIYELYRVNPFKKTALYVVLAVYFIIGIYGTVEIIYKNFSQQYLPVAYERLRAKISPGQTGLVPLTFFFNEYEHYSHLLSNENYKHHATPTTNPAADMATWAYERDVDFILMDYTYRREDFYPELGTEQLPHYKLSYVDNRFAIYKRQ